MNVKSLPSVIVCVPLGVTEPPSPSVFTTITTSPAGIGSNVAEIVWFAVTSEKVYELSEPVLCPSTSRSAIMYPSSGVIVNVMSSPQLTLLVPGVILPPLPADAVIVYDNWLNVTLMFWSVLTLLIVYELFASRVTATPFTVTLPIS